ncbi:hypothetical protein ACFODL_15395 [Phenylobacterium terrae]|uniref:Uncharacterized protein n=1 Tax=Phenylobacterium terrae TaxID=2665495 RepID=A0ABW4NAK8_9CAUL
MSAVTTFLVAARLCDVPVEWVESESQWISPDLYPGLLLMCGDYQTAVDLVAWARAVNWLAFCREDDDAIQMLKPLWDRVVDECPALDVEWVEYTVALSRDGQKLATRLR